MAMDIEVVLSRMRREHTPSAADKERVEKAIQGALLVGTAAGATQLAAGAGKSFASIKAALLTTPVWVKGALGVGACVVAVSGGVYGVNALGNRAEPGHVSRGADVSPRPGSAAVAPATQARNEGATPVTTEPHGMPRPGEETQPPQTAGSAALEVRPSTPRAPALPSLRHPPAPVAPERTATSLTELQLIGSASRALREGRTEEAQSALAEHERRYSNTALSQERLGLEIIARCVHTPSSAATQAAERFLKDSPTSPLAGSLRRECLR